MSTPKKIVVLVAGLVVLIAVSLTVLIQTQVTPEKIRAALLPLVEKKLHRTVDFGNINIGLFSGISVADLKVMQKNGEGEFFSVEAVELSYQFWPLLTGKVVVNRVLLNQPKINLVRLQDGRFNFSDLLPELPEAKKDSATAGNSNDSDTLSAVFNLLIKEINIKDGELLYVDRFKNVKSPFRYTLNNLNIKARQITFDKSFPIDLSAVVNGSNIDISGKYNFSQREANLIIHLAPLNLLQFAPYYRDVFPGRLSSGRLALNLEVDIYPDQISSKGKIVFDDVDLVLEKFPDTGLKKVRLGADYALRYTASNHLLDVSTLLLDFNGINLGAEGEFDLSASEPFLVFSLLFKQFDLRNVMQNLPVELSREYQRYSFAGLIDGWIDFSGKLNSGMDLLKSAQLHLSDVRANSKNLRAGISGDINYSDKVLESENLRLQYGDLRANLQVKAEKFPDDLYHGDFILTADTVDLNTMFTESSGSENGVSKKSQDKPEVEQQKTPLGDIGPFDIPIDMIGTLAINRLIYKKLNIDKITADLSLKNNYLSIQNFSSKIGKGGLKGSSSINLGVKGLTYQGQTSLNQPNVATLVTGLIPETSQSISGLLQWQNSFAGKGTIPKDLLQVLQLKGEFNLQNGEVKGSPLFEGLASLLGKSDLKILSFQSMRGQYDLYDGLTRLSGQLDSSKTKLTPRGTVDLDGRLNLQLDARFAPEVLERLGVSKSLRQTVSDQDGWGTLPLQIKGTLSQPEINYDSTALQNQVLEKTKEKASQKILDKLVPNGGETEPIKQLLDNTLNKLFGK